MLEKMFLKSLLKMKKVDYNNLLFKTEDKSVPKDVDFSKEFGTLYDLLIYLLNNSIRMTASAKDWIMFLEATNAKKNNYLKHENWH